MNYDAATKTISMNRMDAIHCGLDIEALRCELFLAGAPSDMADRCEKIVVRMR